MRGVSNIVKVWR